MSIFGPLDWIHRKYYNVASSVFLCSCWHAGIIPYYFRHGIAIESISDIIPNHISSIFIEILYIIWGWVFVLCSATLNLTYLNFVQFISYYFSNLPSSFWILNLSSISSPVFIRYRRLNSSTNLMSLFCIPFSRSLKKHLSSLEPKVTL